MERAAYTGSKKSYYTWVARQSLALPDVSESFRYDVQIWKLGEALTVFAMEDEVCSPWGPMLRAMARTEQAMVIGYVNNVDAYIPDRRIIREGGYEGGESQKFFLPGPLHREHRRRDQADRHRRPQRPGISSEDGSGRRAITCAPP